MISTIIRIVFVAIVGYLLGNISPARILAKMNGVDITKEGSGNPGTTNVIRTLGIQAGIITFVIDVLKGFIAVAFGTAFAWQWGAYAAFVGVLLGHCFPVLYKFKGGKGVATTLGAALSLCWPAATLAFFVGVLVLLVCKKMSVGSIFAAISFPLFTIKIAPDLLIFASIVAIFIIITHIPNIKRIMSGEEPQLKVGGTNQK